MFFWTPYVFVRTVACFIAGILVGIYQPNLIPERLAVWLLVCLVLLFLVSALRGQRTIYTGPAAMLVLMISGYLHTLYRTDSRHPDHIIHYQGSITGYKVVVSGYPEEKVRSWKVEAAVQALHDGEAWKPCTGKMLLYLSRQDFSSPFHYGDVLLIRGAPNLLREPQNPGEFDYRRFLTFRKIYHQHFLRGGHVQHLSHEPPFRLMEYAMIARAWADKEVRKHVHGKNERAVASALLLGVRDGLDNELVHAYASSGAMHVLAVSGLHVGIIYLILNFLLKPLKSRRYGKWLIAILSVGTLWCYAFITGLSASVLRAVTMFSFMAFARPLSYSTNIFNTLAVAAFCLLMWEPYLIMSVGFQLSFMAVFGIVYLQPRLYLLWEPDNWLADKTWQITCVSISAQAATFALGVLYFHQFPAYFLVSNLFVIPGALLSLSLGILTLALSPVAPLATIAGFVLNGVLKGLNYLVFTVERLPYSLIDNIHITTFQSWMLLGMVIAVALLFEYRKYRYVLFLVGCCVCFGAVQWWHYLENSNHRKLVIYQVSGHSAMEWLDRGRSYFFADSVLLGDTERVRFHIRPNRLIHGVNRVLIKPESFVMDYAGSRLYTWHNVTLLNITGPDFSVPDGLKVDYLVVSNNAVDRLKKISAVRFISLILDGSNPDFTARKLLKEAEEAGMSAYSTAFNGAFVAKLQQHEPY